MRKLVLIALGIGAAVLIQRRAARTGLVPAALVTVAAEKLLEHLGADKPPPPEPTIWQKLFTRKPTPAPAPEGA